MQGSIDKEKSFVQKKVGGTNSENFRSRKGLIPPVNLILQMRKPRPIIIKEFVHRHMWQMSPLLWGLPHPRRFPRKEQDTEWQQSRQPFKVDLKSWVKIIITEVNWFKETKIISKICFTRKSLKQIPSVSKFILNSVPVGTSWVQHSLQTALEWSVGGKTLWKT